MWRATLLRLGEQEHVLLLTMHHIVTDGWSVGVLVRELTTLYEAYSRREASPLRSCRFSMRTLRCGSGSGCKAKCWRSSWVTGASSWPGAAGVLELPTDRARPAVQSYRGAQPDGAVE